MSAKVIRSQAIPAGVARLWPLSPPVQPRSVGECTQDLDSEKGHAADTPDAQLKALDGTPGLAQGQRFDAIYGVRSRYENGARIGRNWSLYHGSKWKKSEIRPLHWRIDSHSGFDRKNVLPAASTISTITGICRRTLIPADIGCSSTAWWTVPWRFSMEDIYRLGQVTRTHFLECNANGYTANPARRAPEATAQVTHGLTSCSMWTGVQASHLMELVGAQKKGTWIVAEGAEGAHHSKSIPMWKVMEDALIVYGQNGEALRPEQGYPLAILLPGFEAIRTASSICAASRS